MKVAAQKSGLSKRFTSHSSVEVKFLVFNVKSYQDDLFVKMILKKFLGIIFDPLF